MLDWFDGKRLKTRKHSSRMRTDRAATRPSSEPAFLRLNLDRQTRVKTLPSLAVVMNTKHQAPGKDLGRFSLWPIAA